MAHSIYTEEERIAARRATWRKYNHAHKAERAAHNKEYVQKTFVKARRSQTRAQLRIQTLASGMTPLYEREADTNHRSDISLSDDYERETDTRVGPTTEIINII